MKRLSMLMTRQRLMRLNWLMMRLMFGQSRACASAASFNQARERDISSLGTKVGPHGLDWVVVEQRAAVRVDLVAAVQYLSILLVGASHAGRLR